MLLILQIDCAVSIRAAEAAAAAAAAVWRE
jgi:hypothetical protein